VHELSSALDCPYCAHRFGLSPQALFELERYQASVHAALGQADVEHRHAAAWHTSAGQMSSGWIGMAVWIVMIALMVVGAFVIQFGLVQGVLPSDLVPALMVTMVFGSLGVTIGVSVWVAARARRSAQRASAGTAQVACPSCGAPNELGAGQTLQTCRYCRAALVPSHTLMTRGVDAARAALRAAELARYRAERLGMQASMSRSAANATAYIVLGSFVPITAGSTMAMTVAAALGDETVPLAGIGLMVALASLNVGLIAAVYAWRSRRKQRFTAALADLAHQFRGRALAGLGGVVAWLNAYWASAYELHYLTAGPCHVAASIDAGGYCALIDIDPVTTHAHYKPRVHILLAGLVPDAGARVASDAVHACRSWLEQAGFSLSVTPSGLLARAQGKTLTRLRKSPEAVHVLSTVITTLVGLAHALGAEPVAAMP
jgi:hypothetical protein